MEKRKKAKTHEDLEVYQTAFEAAMQIFELSKKFPTEERYSLTDQIRRRLRRCGAVHLVRSAPILQKPGGSAGIKQRS